VPDQFVAKYGPLIKKLTYFFSIMQSSIYWD
jgi:hypothetical protein